MLSSYRFRHIAVDSDAHGHEDEEAHTGLMIDR